jgi:O-antigen biosynthesis protein WbqP
MMVAVRGDSVTSFPRWKRSCDLLLGGAGLALAAIPIALISAAILLDSGRPVFLRQSRIGANGRGYLMWKFRTLPQDTPQMSKTELQSIGVRPTRLGRALRRYSLDELPQLLNVVAGDMTLVGPRPALYTQHDLMAMRAAAGILHARPGMTGLAQISGREELTLEEKVALDVEYVRRMSLAFDASIVLRTARAVLQARGSF